MIALICTLVLVGLAAFALTRISTTVKQLKEMTTTLAADRSDLQNRVDALEFQLTSLQGENQRLAREVLSLSAKDTAAKKQRVVAQTESVESVTGTRYFANVIDSGQGYFRGLLDTPDYTAKFIAKASPADPINTMEFEPVDLKTLLSNDGLDKAISITGDVPAEEARSMKVLAPGIATLTGSRWIIISPCKVTFQR